MDHGVERGGGGTYNSDVVWEMIAFQNNCGVKLQEPNLDLAGLVGIEGPLWSDHGLNTSSWTYR